jgi:hypothetical protein
MARFIIYGCWYSSNSSTFGNEINYRYVWSKLIRFPCFIFIDYYFIKQSLRTWCDEYIRRIDENFDRKLRWIILLLFKAFLFLLLNSQLISLFSLIPEQVLLSRSSIAFCFSIKFLREISSLYISIPWTLFDCSIHAIDQIEFLVRSLAIRLNDSLLFRLLSFTASRTNMGIWNENKCLLKEDREELITIGNNVKRGTRVRGRYSHICVTEKGHLVFFFVQSPINIYETTSVKLVRDECVRCRLSIWLSIVLVLLFIGVVLTLASFISTSSRNTNILIIFINYIHTNINTDMQDVKKEIKKGENKDTLTYTIITVDGLLKRDILLVNITNFLHFWIFLLFKNKIKTKGEDKNIIVHVYIGTNAKYLIASSDPISL